MPSASVPLLWDTLSLTDSYSKLLFEFVSKTFKTWYMKVDSSNLRMRVGKDFLKVVIFEWIPVGKVRSKQSKGCKGEVRQREVRQKRWWVKLRLAG